MFFGLGEEERPTRRKKIFYEVKHNLSLSFNTQYLKIVQIL